MLEDCLALIKGRNDSKKNPTKKSDEEKNASDSEHAKYEAWKTKVKMCKTYMFYQVLKSFIWKNTYSNTNSMFDVSGENQEADNDSNKQKAGLVDCFEKMEYQKTMDKVIDNFLIHGELITYVGWKKKTEEYQKYYAMSENSASLDKKLKKANIYDYIIMLPDGLDTSVGERGVRFSGGQAQRLAIARALYRNPEILILDEATSALDNETEAAIMDSINRLHGKKTLIIIAHRLQTIEKCDMVYSIKGKKAVLDR